MLLKITHTTRYTYAAPVSYALQQVRLTPLNSAAQTVRDWHITIAGGVIELSFPDQYQNETLLVQTNTNETELTLTVTGEVETHCTDGVYGMVYDTAPLWHFLEPTRRTTPGAGTRKLSRIVATADDMLAGLHALSAAIIAAVPFNTTHTIAGTTAEEALAAGGGVCQDHAQVFVTAARLAGIPARYVSGYLMMNDRVDQDASHAWAEAHIDGLGWVGFDVSNGYCPDERYVRIAIGRDSRDAAPISGMRLGGAAESMIVSLQVQQ